MGTKTSRSWALELGGNHAVAKASEAPPSYFAPSRHGMFRRDTRPDHLPQPLAGVSKGFKLIELTVIRALPERP